MSRKYQSEIMFIRDKQPSETSRKITRGILVGYWIGLVAFTALYNLFVAAHLLFVDTSPLWVWLQIGGVLLLAASIALLVYRVRKSRPQ